MPEGRTRVLFVCLANLCRSPMAEAIFRDLVRRSGLSARIEAESAGVAVRHEGLPPHMGTLAELARQGISSEGIASRCVRVEDLAGFDHVLAADRQVLRVLKGLRAADVPDSSCVLDLLLRFDPAGGRLDVPDPYFVGGFEEVFAIIERACQGLLDHLKKKLPGTTDPDPDPDRREHLC